MSDPIDTDAEMRAAIRDLCVAVAEIAAGTVHLLGTTHAETIVSGALAVSRRMDAMEDTE